MWESLNSASSVVTIRFCFHCHPPDGHGELIRRLGAGDALTIALEPTGGCEWALWEALEEAGFDVRQVSAAQVRSFARSLGNLAKTDPLDARMITRFIAFRPDAGRRLPAESLRKLNVLTTKRRQLVKMRKRLSCQIKQRASQELNDFDEAHMVLMQNQIKILEEWIETMLQNDDHLKQRSQILLSIPGIGPVLARYWPSSERRPDWPDARTWEHQ